MNKIKQIFSDKDSNHEDLSNTSENNISSSTGTTSSRGAGTSPSTSSTTGSTGTSVGGLGNTSSTSSSSPRHILDRASHKHDDLATLPTDGTSTISDHKHLAAITSKFFLF